MPPAESLPACYARLAATGLVDRLLVLARDEDLFPTGRDATSDATASASGSMTARVVAREPGVVAGLAAVPDLLRTFAVDLAFAPACADADAVLPAQTLATLAGPAHQVLLVERTLLNLLGRLSGVASLTARFVRAVEGTGAAVCDTRKTTPGLRVLEKYAVRCGGGVNHRLSLADAVLIKDNHLAGLSPPELARRVSDASARARKSDPAPAFVEVEVDRPDQLDAVLALPPGTVDLVLLDNFAVDALRRAVARRDALAPRVRLEASGGVTLESVRAIASTGVDRVSVGALTHHAVWLDLGLDA